MARPPSTLLPIPNVDRVADSCVSPDGTLLAFLYFDGSVRVYESDEHRKFSQIAETAPCCRRGTCISMTSAGEFGDIFVVGDEQGRTYLFHRSQPAEFTQAVGFSQHKGPINAIAFAPVALAFACASSDGMASVTSCDMKTWSVAPVRVAMAPVTSVSWSPPACFSFVDAPNASDDAKLVVGSADGTISIFQFQPPGALVPELPPIQAHIGAVNSVAWRPLAGFARAEIATCGADRMVTLWTIERDGRITNAAVAECAEEPVELRWSPCGFVLSATSGAATVTLYHEADDRTWAPIEMDD
jgi:WD40 repeat protein